MGGGQQNGTAVSSQSLISDSSAENSPAMRRGGGGEKGTLEEQVREDIELESRGGGIEITLVDGRDIEGEQVVVNTTIGP